MKYYLMTSLALIALSTIKALVFTTTFYPDPVQAISDSNVSILGARDNEAWLVGNPSDELYPVGGGNDWAGDRVNGEKRDISISPNRVTTIEVPDELLSA